MAYNESITLLQINATVESLFMSIANLKLVIAVIVLFCLHPINKLTHRAQFGLIQLGQVIQNNLF